MKRHDTTRARRRVLLTGAGGPAAVSFVRSLVHEPIDFYAVDIDPYAAGLYLVPEERRGLVPPGEAPGFVDVLLERCAAWDIDVLVPTVDCELPAVAADSRFADLGVVVLGQSAHTLDVCLDKWQLIERCRTVVPVPATTVLGPDTAVEAGRLPMIVKPRRGSGSRGVRTVHSVDEVRACPSDGSHLLQELLPGAEYSVDVLVRRDGQVVAAVPRARLKVDSGVAVTARTVHDPELEALSVAVAREVGLRGIANIQWRCDTSGQPRLLEVNPRIPGTLPLTVAAGVDMPKWALADVLGHAVPEWIDFDEVAVVRHWDEQIVPTGDLAAMERAARSQHSPLAATRREEAA